MPLLTSQFDYDLPAELIAQTPALKRDQSRLMVINRNTKKIEHKLFKDLPDYLNSNDILFRNNASVLPARLHGIRPTGGAVECLLLEKIPSEIETWRCLLKPGRKLPKGNTFSGLKNEFIATILNKEEDGIAEVAFKIADNSSLVSIARSIGEMPLPPYIVRKNQEHHAEDTHRYQTVYADHDKPVAAAAPTAGLHFTAEILNDLGARGIKFQDLTLHVGLGTFKPITTDTVEEHKIHKELYEISESTQQALFKPRIGRHIAVGTTSVRTIEDFLSTYTSATNSPVVKNTAIYIYPPYRFKGVEGLITNFHQPKSTLLCLVSSFLTPGSNDGITWIKEIYSEAISLRYRFFSYGDAMLIL
jgi:S-adenosylmethionine:tRNA ribosyltransferase-isomerase